MKTGRVDECYKVADRQLHHMNSIHLCAKYNPRALQVILYCLDEHNIWKSKSATKILLETLEDQENPLKMTPLHLAVENKDPMATRFLYILILP